MAAPINRAVYQIPDLGSKSDGTSLAQRNLMMGALETSQRSTNGKPTVGEVTNRQDGVVTIEEIGTETKIKPAPLPSYGLYRLIDTDPTVTEVRGIIEGQVMSGTVGVTASAGAPDTGVKLLQEAILPIVHDLILDCLGALSMGAFPGEVIWDYVELDGLEGRWQVPIRVKPLAIEHSLPLVDKGGQQVGLQNIGYSETADLTNTQPVELFGPKYFWYVNDQKEAGGSLFGKSRHENIRELAWWPWILTNIEGMKIDKKASGRVFTVAGPPNERANAKAIAESLQAGTSAYMTNYMTGQTPRMDPKMLHDLSKVTGYNIQQWDLGTTAQSAEAVLNKLKYYDALKFRGWKRPERTGQEGSRGTLAEAEEHGDTAETDSDLIFSQIIKYISRKLAQDTIVLNMGEKFRNRYHLKPGPLSALNAATDMRILDAVLNDPHHRSEFILQTDVDAVMGRRNIPKLVPVVKFTKPPEPPKPQAPNPKPENRPQ